jgi:hypothetical protein
LENAFDQWIEVFLILCGSLWQLFPGFSINSELIIISLYR